MTASHGNRMAAAASPPVSAFPWAEPVATTRRTRCAKRSARSPALTAGSGANALAILAVQCLVADLATRSSHDEGTSFLTLAFQASGAVPSDLGPVAGLAALCGSDVGVSEGLNSLLVS